MIRKKLEIKEIRHWSNHKTNHELFHYTAHQCITYEFASKFDFLRQGKKFGKYFFDIPYFFVFQTTEVPSTLKTEIKIECLDGNCNNNTPKDDNQKSKPRKGVEQKSSKKELDNPKIIDLHKFKIKSR